MAFDISIAPGSAAPIYRQIVDGVRLLVAGGEAKPGDRLPSVRALSERLVVNPNTVAKAYAELLRDGVIESQQGRGVFVIERRQIFSDGERRRRLGAAAAGLVSEGLLLNFSAEEIRRAVDRTLARFVGRASRKKTREVSRE